MSQTYDLERFITAQNQNYHDALAEMKRGKKITHWMWYVFPQIAGLGYSQLATFYAIKDVEEAKLYLAHPITGGRLLDITEALLAVRGKTAYDIFGSPDDLKLKSSMTLFEFVSNGDSVFTAVLETYFAGERDDKTLRIIERMNGENR